ncbi:MAG TPA: hypothetical protein VH309_09120, partial [Elusimicrobiota bacterium]|nr:hypothetical protein [Elusimicrobiota bacterium]
MSRKIALLTAFLLCARSAAAHDYPIKPVSVVILVEPDRVVADIDSDSTYWIEEVVGLHPMPPHDWPADAISKAQDYVNAHLRLKADGKVLTGRLVEESYVQRPWEVNEQGRFHLRVEYPPLDGAATLSGEADFFEEYRRERLDARLPVLPFQDFRAIVTVPGRVPARFALTPGAD